MNLLAESTNCVLLMVPLLIATLAQLSLADPELRCLVCRAVIDEIEDNIKRVNPKKKIQVGNYRIDADGNQKKNEIQYARSEIHLQDVMESVCEKLEDYAQAKYKDTGERTIIKLIGSDGAMNPIMAKVDLTPDPDLNKMLKYYCENLIEDQEDEIIRIFSKSLKDPDIELCTKKAGVCDDKGDDDDDSYNFEEKQEL